MTSSMNRRIAAGGVVALLTLAAFVLMVATAQAAAPLTQLQRAHGGAAVTYAAAPLTQLQRAHGAAAVTYAPAGPAGGTAYFGRGGVFVTPTRTAASGAALAGGFALTAVLIALAAFVGLRWGDGRRAELAQVTSIGEAPSARPASRRDRQERRAA